MSQQPIPLRFVRSSVYDIPVMNYKLRIRYCCQCLSQRLGRQNRFVFRLSLRIRKVNEGKCTGFRRCNERSNRAPDAQRLVAYPEGIRSVSLQICSFSFVDHFIR
ncbi:hypothetical protein D3C73_1407240 [compost metagenome]